MKLLFDFHQTLISNILMEHHKTKSLDVNPDLVRHMVLSSIKKYKKMFNPKDRKDIVLCCDNHNYWRRAEFPYYKANRKKARTESPLDWKLIYNTINGIKNEMRNDMPYTVLEYERAEADDIIATLCKLYGDTSEEIVIISSDKDLLQLQKWKNVKQYSPWHKKMLTIPDPQEFLKEHIIDGDPGDGIPNCLSADDCFISGSRQSRITKNRRQEFQSFFGVYENSLPDKLVRGLKRNQKLIDLSYIPMEISKGIISQYNELYNEEKNVTIYQYFRKTGLVEHLRSLQDF